MVVARPENSGLKVYMAVLSAAYVACRLAVEFFRQTIQVMTDSQDYLFNAAAELNFDFFCYSKPAGTALIYKLLQNDHESIVAFQIILSIVSWLVFALVFTTWIKPHRLKFFSFPILLLLSLSQDVMIWDTRILTESISVSVMVLLIAFFSLVLRSRSPLFVILLICTGTFWALIKETNSYLLFLTAVTLLVFGIFLKDQKRQFIIGVVLLAVFLLNLGFSNLGERWKFPLLNIIGQRILVEPEAVSFFEKEGMPVTPALMEMKHSFGYSADFSFLNSPELRSFQTWFHKNGQKVYLKYLLVNFGKSLSSPVIHLRDLLEAENRFPIFSLASWSVPITILYLLLIGLLITITLKLEHPAKGLFCLYLLASLYPHLFIVWIGDAWEVSRHAFSARVQLSVGLCLGIFVILEQVWAHGLDSFRMDLKVAMQKTIHRLDGTISILGKGFISTGLLLASFFVVYDLFSAAGYFELDFHLGMKQMLGVLGGLTISGIGGALLYISGKNESIKKLSSQ